jgi:hypothetical protein
LRNEIGEVKAEARVEVEKICPRCGKTYSYIEAYKRGRHPRGLGLRWPIFN